MKRVSRLVLVAMLLGAGAGWAKKPKRTKPRAAAVAPVELPPSECSRAFSQSPASRTCKAVQITTDAEGACVIETSCQAGPAVYLTATVTGPSDEMPNLTNCSGRLKLGGC